MSRAVPETVISTTRRSREGGVSAHVPTKLLITTIALALTISAQAHEISFDRSTIRSDEYVTLTISLEGNFIGVDHVQLPLENLTLVAGPSTSTEFRWINGQTSRRRVLIYRLRPNGPGSAAVGPVVLSAPNGDQLTLRRVTVNVLDPIRDGSTLEGSLSLARLPAVIVEVSDRNTWVGGQIEVRWSLYGENIRGVQLLELPSLDGFWVEQLEVDETTREVIRIGDELVQRQTLRHALLYPLRSGTYQIEPMMTSVRVYRRDPFGDVGGWNPFGGNVVELTRQSEPVTIEVSEATDPSLPIGRFDLRCSDPNVPTHGPVAIDLHLSAAANLRSVAPPEFAGDLAADVELEPLSISMRERDGSIVMQRGWRYLLFPRQSGDLAIPPLQLRFFDPEAGAARTARCGGWTVAARASGLAPADEGAPTVQSAREDGPSFLEQYWIPATVTLAVLLLLVPLAMRLSTRDRSARRILGHLEDPQRVRQELESWLVRRGYHPSRLRERRDDVGEAWRSVSSLLDLMQREPWEQERGRDELRRRIEELFDEV